MRSHQSPNVSYILFSIYPVAALISALRNFKAPKAQNIVWAFIVFYGFTFVLSSRNLDADRYIRTLQYMHTQEAESVTQFVTLLYNDEANYVDVVQPFISFVVSRFTDDGRVLMAAFALVFGFFYTRNVWFLLSHVDTKVRREAIPFLLLAVFVVAMWHINGFRFWTATHVFAYGVFHFTSQKRVKGLLFVGLSVFVHFSFALPVALFLIFVLVGRRLTLFFILYVTSFFIAQVSPDVLSSYAGSIPSVFQERTSIYTSSEYIATRSVETLNLNWYVRGRMEAMRYAIIVLLTFLMLRHRSTLVSNVLVSRLLSIALLVGATANILANVPSMERFQLVFYLILFTAVFIFVQQQSHRLLPQVLRIMIVGVATLYLLVEIRVGFNTIGLTTVLGNPFIAPFIENDIPLIDLIK